jgi:hypothetical protein
MPLTQPDTPRFAKAAERRVWHALVENNWVNPIC